MADLEIRHSCSNSHEDHALKSNELYDLLCNNIKSAISYYKNKKKLPSHICKTIRISALVTSILSIAFPLFYFTGVVELIFSLFDILKYFDQYEDLISNAGYIWLGICGIFVMAERILRGSEAWFRYIEALLDLQFLLAQLELEWAKLSDITGGDGGTKDREPEKIAIIEKFSDSFCKILKAETDKWNASQLVSWQQFDSYSNKNF